MIKQMHYALNARDYFFMLYSVLINAPIKALNLLAPDVQFIVTILLCEHAYVKLCGMQDHACSGIILY